MHVSERSQRITPSPTLAISAKAKRLRAQGVDVISFDAGEPDFDTPAHIKQAAIDALNAGFTKYTAAAGTDDLRAAICEKLQRENGLAYEPANIVVSCGGKHALYNIAQATLNPGDEVVIPAPYWVSYPDQVLLNDGKPVIVAATAETAFKISPAQLAAALTARTRLVVINSPSNPTGTVYTPDELRALAAVLAAHPTTLVISDEIYEHNLYDGNEQWSIARYSDDLKRRTLVTNSFSKTYSMTGWRLGWTACEKPLADAIGKIQSQSTSNPTSFAQAGAVAALRGPQDCVAKMCAEFDRRRKRIVQLLNEIPSVTCLLPGGAFYVFPDVSGLFGKTLNGSTINSANDLSEYLLSHAKVSVVPGEGFGAPNHVRLSYATSFGQIEAGVARIKAAVA